MGNLKRIVEKSDTKTGKAFDLAVQFLIVVSLIAFSLETLPNLSHTTLLTLHYIEIACVAVFTVEYLLRVAVASNRFAFVTSFFGIVDLIAILPFYFATGVDLRAVRAFRLLRIFRILGLSRFNKTIARFRVALKLAREELILFLSLSGIVLYLSAVGIYYFENPTQPEIFQSIFHSLWWAIITLTTVGYGDMYPITLGGRLFTFLILMVGLGLVSVPAGLVASSLSKAREMESESNK